MFKFCFAYAIHKYRLLCFIFVIFKLSYNYKFDFSYVEWSLHEPYPGVFNFEDMADLEYFLQLIKDEGMYVLLRPGPYICAERDFVSCSSYDTFCKRNDNAIIPSVLGRISVLAVERGSEKTT